MSAWTFTAQAVPRGQPRVRATAFGGRARVWTPSTADGFKSAVAIAAREAVEPDRWPIRHGWTLTAVFYLPRPQRLMGRKGGAKEMIPHTARPDLDNLVKAAVDALVDSGIVHDDAPLYMINCAKFYAEPDGTARAEFTLEANTDTEKHG